MIENLFHHRYDIKTNGHKARSGAWWGNSPNSGAAIKRPHLFHQFVYLTQPDMWIVSQTAYGLHNVALHAHKGSSLT